MNILQSVFLFIISALLFACKSQDSSNELRQIPHQNASAKDKVEEVNESIKKLNKEKKDFDHYFIENHITNQAPQAITRNILESKQGDIWFASFQGIFRYDGINFYNHTNLDSLRRYRAFSLLEDNLGRIWIGTIGAGVYIYDERSIVQGKSPWTNLNTKDGLVNDDVGSLFEDSKGNVWIGTRVGVSCYDGNIFKNYTKENGLSDNDINGIIEDKSGKIWFAARGEACYFDGNDFTKITREDGKPFYNARSIILDSRGNIWLGGNDGLWCYDGQLYQDFDTPFIGNIYEDSKGTIWVSQSEVGQIYSMTLNRYDLHNLYSSLPKSTHVASGNGQIFGMIEDSKGNIWFGHERGICKYDGHAFNYFKD